MNTRLIAPGLFLFLFAWTSGANAEGVRTVVPGPEAAGRAGTDIGVGGEAASMKTNPAGMAWLRRNRTDITAVGLFNKLDLEDSSGTRFNGDQALFGGNWAYAFTPKKLASDPFRQWAIIKHKAEESFTSRSRYEGRILVPISKAPVKLELRGSGIGFWISDMVLRGRATGDRMQTRFVLPEIEPLPPERPVLECKVEFEFLLESKVKKVNAPSLTLTAYGRNESILLKAETGKWTRGSVTMTPSRTRLPPACSLTAVAERGVSVSLRNVAFLRTFGQGGRRAETRQPVPDEALEVELDPGASKVILATNPGPLPTSRTEESLWVVEGADRFKGEELTEIVLEFRYGFEGGAAKGDLSVLIDGKQSANKHLEPVASFAPAEEDMERRRKAVDWLEREKVHIGVGVFTDSLIGAGYGNLPSDVGEHEGQLRFALYSISLGAAVELHPSLAIGASLSLYHGRFFNLDGTFSQPASFVIRPFLSDYLAQTGSDRLSLQVESGDIFAWGGGALLGMLVRPIDEVALGVTFQSPVHFGRYEGRAHADLTDDFDFTGFDNWILANVALPMAGDTGFDGEYDVSIRGFRMPLRAGAGASVRLFEKLMLAAEVEFIGWTKAFDRLTLKFTRGSNPNADTITGSTFRARIPLAFKDQWTASFGLSADVHENATLHAGYRWASSPVKGDASHPMFPAHAEHFLSVGMTLKHRALSFHLAVQHGFDAELHIAKSVHDPLFDGSTFTLRQETAVVGISYEY